MVRDGGAKRQTVVVVVVVVGDVVGDVGGRISWSSRLERAARRRLLLFLRDHADARK